MVLPIIECSMKHLQGQSVLGQLHMQPRSDHFAHPTQLLNFMPMFRPLKWAGLWQFRLSRECRGPVFTPRMKTFIIPLWESCLLPSGSKTFWQMKSNSPAISHMSQPHKSTSCTILSVHPDQLDVGTLLQVLVGFKLIIICPPTDNSLKEFSKMDNFRDLKRWNLPSTS